MKLFRLTPIGLALLASASALAELVPDAPPPGGRVRRTRSTSSVRMEHNSFLKKPVFSRQQLLDQYRADAEVRARYAAHFKVKSSRIDDYFETLRLAPLPVGKRYLAYNVDPKTKKVGRRLLFFPKGTLVFVDAKGKPVLKRSCGNPMVSYVPAAGKTAIAFVPQKEEEESIAAVAPQTTETTPATEEEIAMVPETPVVETPVQPVQPAQPIQPEPIAPTPEFPPAVILASGGALGSLLPVAIVGAVAGVAGATGPRGDTPVVPEPATMTIMAVGAGMSLYRKRRKRD